MEYFDKIDRNDPDYDKVVELSVEEMVDNEIDLNPENSFRRQVDRLTEEVVKDIVSALYAYRDELAANRK